MAERKYLKCLNQRHCPPDARSALAKCARIDECKSWADRAAALASYAKQADDEQLLNNAKRIKARAIDRIGELAEEIPPAKNQHDAAERARTGADPSRIKAAYDAGISPRQLKTALQVHAVPRDEFERQVESDSPPTITELARQGTKETARVPEARHSTHKLEQVVMWDIRAARYHLEDAIQYMKKNKHAMSRDDVELIANAFFAVDKMALAATEEMVKAFKAREAALASG